MKYVLCYSGGLDSSTLLYCLKKHGHEVYPLIVDYGQRHRKEMEAATRIANSLNISPHRVTFGEELRHLLQGSSQTSKGIPVPEGHYTEESMKATVVPNRNMILLSLAAGWAISLKADGVAYAAHAGDHAIYPDCRSEFIHKMRELFLLCDWHKLTLYTPFSSISKANIVTIGHEIGVPFELTWSCYKGGEKHCGKCGTCVERREAFQVAGITDPTEYEV